MIGHIFLYRQSQKKANLTEVIDHVRSRPGLAGILTRLEERVVIEWIDEIEYEDDEDESEVVNFGVQMRLLVDQPCTLL